MRKFLGGRVTLHPGDCLDVLKTLPDASIDSVVTDPPYGLSFMGRGWDHGVPGVIYWQEVLRVLKPGGHLVAFGGTRTYHRLAVAIEDAGLEVRDQLAWVYGSGFPKSHNVEKNGGGEDWIGWGTALKPAWEPICLARKPLVGTVVENVLEHGTGAINIDGCRVEHVTVDGGSLAKNPHLRGTINGGNGGNIFPTEDKRRVVTPNNQGRFPANLIHDGSEEVVSCFPSEAGASAPVRGDEPSRTGMDGTNCYGEYGRVPGQFHGDSGSAARFFYASKADSDDRLGSRHPTIKPVDLMQWLVRLVTPKGGTCLDPFAGTGTTGEAAWREGMRAILIEREPEYQDDIARRMDLADKPTKRAAVAKTKNKLDDPASLPLFAGEKT